MSRAFAKDSMSTWYNQDSNPGPPDPEAKCLPLDLNATCPWYLKSVKNDLSQKGSSLTIYCL